MTPKERADMRDFAGASVVAIGPEPLRVYLERAIAAAIAEEREACAKVCEAQAAVYMREYETTVWRQYQDMSEAVEYGAELIRARGKP
jgi:hypothetical protein